MTLDKDNNKSFLKSKLTTGLSFLKKQSETMAADLNKKDFKTYVSEQKASLDKTLEKALSSKGDEAGSKKDHESLWFEAYWQKAAPHFWKNLQNVKAWLDGFLLKDSKAATAAAKGHQKSIKKPDMTEDEENFVPIRVRARYKQPQEWTKTLLYSVAIFFGVLLLWSAIAKVDEITRGEGKVVASSKTQIIDNLEGGIVSEIYVKEGQQVHKDQPLLRITNQMAESDLQEAKEKINTLQAKIIRIEAEIREEVPQYSERFTELFPRLVHEELKIFEARNNQLKAQTDVLESQAEQKKQEVDEMEAKHDQLSRAADLTKQQLDMTSPLVAKGAVSKVEVLKLEKDYNEIRGDLKAAELTIPRLQNAYMEAQQRVLEKKATFKAEASEELSKYQLDFNTLTQAITADEDRVSRTEVKSPVNGVVKQILVNTVGGVIKPGEDLLEVVPIEDSLVIEAKISPKDVAFLRPGLGAVVKISAYDYSIYGGLDAKLIDISADTIADEKGNQFYHIKLVTDKNFLGTPVKPLPIIPGMIANVDILTGKKSILSYLLKPIMKAKQMALTER